MVASVQKLEKLTGLGDKLCDVGVGHWVALGQFVDQRPPEIALPSVHVYNLITQLSVLAKDQNIPGHRALGTLKVFKPPEF